MNAQRATLCKDHPFSIILALAYPQMDFANRWCWQQFGSPQGMCYDHYSEYPSCNETAQNHYHEGRWQTHWWEKLGYDFGYNEWFFAEQMDYEAFCAFIPHICFGEHYDEQLQLAQVRLGVSRNRTNAIKISQKHSYGYAVANRTYASWWFSPLINMEKERINE